MPVDGSSDQSRNIFTQPTGNTGVPSRYDVLGNSILLDVAPNYNYSNGLKVVFQRNGVKFVYTDTTATPGIPSLFHMYLPRVASLPFLIENGKVNKNDVAEQIRIDEEAIKDFYSNRIKYRKTGITPMYRSSR